MKLLALALTLLISTHSQAKPASVTLVNDPESYASQVSLLYAEGDTNDRSGWLGCDTAIAPVGVQSTCHGERSILVFGGHEVRKEFTCDFTFHKTVSGQFTISDADENCN